MQPLHLRFDLYICTASKRYFKMIPRSVNLRIRPVHNINEAIMIRIAVL